MCVILVCEDKKPSKDILKKCKQANNDGIGIAWTENGESKFEKGICFNRLIELVDSKPLPLVIHFRITSAGITSEAMAHPFVCSNVIDKGILEAQGKNLLFHNGTLYNWQDKLINLAMNYKFKIEDLNYWNDTRYMAIASHYIGIGILELFNEKLVYMASNGDITIFNKQKFNFIDGIYYSNTYWQSTPMTTAQVLTVQTKGTKYNTNYFSNTYPNYCSYE